MKPFDLEAFKMGAPAIRRDGKKAYFGAYFPDNLALRLFVLEIQGDKKSGYLVMEDGKFFSYSPAPFDLVGMAEDAEIEQVNRG